MIADEQHQEPQLAWGQPQRLLALEVIAQEQGLSAALEAVHHIHVQLRFVSKHRSAGSDGGDDLSGELLDAGLVVPLHERHPQRPSRRLTHGPYLLVHLADRAGGAPAPSSILRHLGEPPRPERHARPAHHVAVLVGMVGHRQRGLQRPQESALAALAPSQQRHLVQHPAREVRRQLVLLEDLLHHGGDLLRDIGRQGHPQLGPGGEARRIAELIEVHIGADKRLLGYVLSVLPPAHDAVGHAVHVTLITGYQRAVGLAVAAPREAHQLSVCQVTHIPLLKSRATAGARPSHIRQRSGGKGRFRSPNQVGARHALPLHESPGLRERRQIVFL